jgi:hypothetical protein
MKQLAWSVLLGAALSSGAISSGALAQAAEPSPSAAAPAELQVPPSNATTPPAEPAPSAPLPPSRQIAPEPEIATPAPPHHHHHGESHGCGDCMPRARGDFMPAVFAGAGLFELAGLNDRLDDAGYSRIDGFSPVIGGELRVIHPSGFLTSLYGAALLPNTGSGPDRLRASLRGGFGLLDAGWAFVHLPGFTLSLSGGVGGYWTSLDIYQRGDAEFADVLENPRRGTSLGVSGLLLGAVLRADGRIPLGPPRHYRQSYLAVGLRVTGLWGPALSGWDFAEHDNQVDDGPAGHLSGVYAAVVIGWGNTAIEPQL